MVIYGDAMQWYYFFSGSSNSIVEQQPSHHTCLMTMLVMKKVLIRCSDVVARSTNTGSQELLNALIRSTTDSGILREMAHQKWQQILFHIICWYWRLLRPWYNASPKTSYLMKFSINWSLLHIGIRQNHILSACVHITNTRKVGRLENGK